MSTWKMLQKQKLLSFTLILFTLSLGILIGTLITGGVRAQKDAVAPDATPLKIPDPVQLQTAFSQIAKKLEPSVVNITTTYVSKRATADSRRRQQTPQEDPEEFFRRFFAPFGQIPEEPQRRDANGSGVIVDPNGYILTNHHVVEDADRIQVRLTGDPPGREYPAKLIGADPETDLAVIKIDAPRKLTPAKIGNSDAVQVGDWAIAIGSPFGLQATVTAGIISAKDRDIAGGRQFQHFLQTDAAINPGNSGGPLLSINGEVIGINTAIATTGRTFAGVGFALPINTAVKVYNQIIKTGRMTRGSIGVSLQQATPELLKVYGASQGAFVSRVEPGSPAAKAGIREQDVIVSFDGKPIARSDDLVNAVADTPVGTQVKLGVIRDGKRIEIPVTVGDRAEIYRDNPLISGRRPEDSSRDEGPESKFGMYVRNADPAELEGSGEAGGVLVTRVDPASFADDIGILPGDVITSVNREPVRSVDDLRRIQATLKPGDVVAFRVLRPAPRTGGRGGRTWNTFFPAGTLPQR